MSASEVNLGLDSEYDARTILALGAFVFVGLYFFSLKNLFGSYNIFHIMDEFKKHKKTDERYSRLFETRENLCHHIGWARSRGENVAEIRKMIAELKAVELAIDEMEKKHFNQPKKSQDC